MLEKSHVLIEKIKRMKRFLSLKYSLILLRQKLKINIPGDTFQDKMSSML